MILPDSATCVPWRRGFMTYRLNSVPRADMGFVLIRPRTTPIATSPNASALCCIFPPWATRCEIKILHMTPPPNASPHYCHDGHSEQLRHINGLQQPDPKEASHAKWHKWRAKKKLLPSPFTPKGMTRTRKRRLDDPRSIALDFDDQGMEPDCKMRGVCHRTEKRGQFRAVGRFPESILLDTLADAVIPLLPLINPAMKNSECPTNHGTAPSRGCDTIWQYFFDSVHDRHKCKRTICSDHVPVVTHDRDELIHFSCAVVVFARHRNEF